VIRLRKLIFDIAKYFRKVAQLFNWIIAPDDGRGKHMGVFLKSKIWKITCLVLLPGFFLILLAGCEPEPGQNSNAEKSEEGMILEEVSLKGHAVMMELALTPEERARGLMGRESMADDEGMLFVYPDTKPYPAEVSFWMKDCLIPIDVIFLSRKGEIVSIHEMEPPEPGTPDEDLKAYPSGEPVQFAIEVRGGLAQELGLKAGDIIELRFEYLMDMAS